MGLARILIAEAPADIARLFARFVEHLGHEPLLHKPRAKSALPDCDVLLVEPALPAAAALVEAVRARRPGLPVICTSIYPPTPEALALQPVAYLLKPFGVVELAAAIEAALTVQRPLAAPEEDIRLLPDSS